MKGEFHKVDYSEESGRVSRCHICLNKTTEEGDTFSNFRTPANDPRNQGKKIPGWGFDPDWVNGTLMMASLVFDATKPIGCPL